MSKPCSKARGSCLNLIPPCTAACLSCGGPLLGQSCCGGHSNLFLCGRGCLAALGFLQRTGNEDNHEAGQCGRSHDGGEPEGVGQPACAAHDECADEFA